MSDHVVFRLGGQRYAVAAGLVEEIVRVVAGARLPAPPPLVESVIDFHGRLVPVLDVRARFGLSPKAVELSDRLIVARAGARTVALRVDDVDEVASLISDSPESVAPVLPHVAGLARTPEGIVVIHDLAAFLSAAEGDAVDAALAAAGASG